MPTGGSATSSPASRSTPARYRIEFGLDDGGFFTGLSVDVRDRGPLAELSRAAPARAVRAVDLSRVVAGDRTGRRGRRSDRRRGRADRRRFARDLRERSSRRCSRGRRGSWRGSARRDRSATRGRCSRPPGRIARTMPEPTSSSSSSTPIRGSVLRRRRCRRCRSWSRATTARRPTERRPTPRPTAGWPPSSPG